MLPARHDDDDDDDLCVIGVGVECSLIDRTSNPGRVIPKTQKMVLEAD